MPIRGRSYLFNFGLTTAVQQVGYNLVSWSYTEKRDLSSYLLTRIAPTACCQHSPIFIATYLRIVGGHYTPMSKPYETDAWHHRKCIVASSPYYTHYAHRNSYSPLWTSFASNFAVSRIRFFFFLSSRPESRSVSFNVNQYGGRSNIASLFITVGLKAIIFMVRHRNR